MNSQNFSNWKKESAQFLEDVMAGDIKMEAIDECSNPDYQLPMLVVRLEINLCTIAELIHPDSRKAFEALIRVKAGKQQVTKAVWTSVKVERYHVGKNSV